MRIWAALGVVCILTYAVLTYYGIYLSGAPIEGLLSFDARVLGYSAGQARDYIGAMGEGGRALYLGKMAVTDTVFPLALSAFLGWGTWMFSAKRWLIAMPIVYCVVDLFENALTRLLVRNWLDFKPALAERASLLTQGKYLFVIAVIVTCGTVWWRREI